jgi:hypothetical protein
MGQGGQVRRRQGEVTRLKRGDDRSPDVPQWRWVGDCDQTAFERRPQHVAIIYGTKLGRSLR